MLTRNAVKLQPCSRRKNFACPLPLPRRLPAGDNPDKFVHLFIFAVFAFLLIQGFRKKDSPATVQKYALLWAILICLFIGGSTELLQGWVIPLRTADWYDFFADSAGTLGVVAALGAHRFLLSE